MDQVKDDFKEALKHIKEDLTRDKWMQLRLESDMRNQVIISNIKVDESGTESDITRLETRRNILFYLLLDITLFDKIVHDWKWKVHI